MTASGSGGVLLRVWTVAGVGVRSERVQPPHAEGSPPGVALSCWRSVWSTCGALRLSACAATGAGALDSSTETAKGRRELIELR